MNKQNLTAQAEYVETKHLLRQSGRQAIAISPLHENQKWLFDVIYDRRVPETRSVRVPIPMGEGAKPWYLEAEQSEIRDHDESVLKTALQVVRQVLRDNSNASFRISRRGNRFVGLHGDDGMIVPNIFQLSSGETSLFNTFLSILRDFEMSGSQFSNAADIRGIVVVDEMDLHLHAVHQHEVLPSLIGMFPKVQFIVTTHSPLFVLGMHKAFGEDGFGLYQLPRGHQISPEEFSEFGDAFQVFAATRTFNDDMRLIIKNSQRPVVFVEGITDQRYIEKAAQLFGKEAIVESLEIRDGGGSGNLAKIWKDSILPLTMVLPQQVLLLFDCDTGRPPDRKGKLVQRSIPLQVQSPIGKGIENLFSKPTLEKARQHKPGFFITEEEHGGTDKGGHAITIPEKWTINESEKGNLCDWLCENGTLGDFQKFQLIFDMIEEAVGLSTPSLAGTESETTP